jgi:hypothetical protein
MRNIDNPAFVADKVIAQEMLITIMINAWMNLYPEITEKIIQGLDAVLDSPAIPTPGARANLEKIRSQIGFHQPTQTDSH